MKNAILLGAALGGLAVVAAIYGVHTWNAIGPTDMGFTGWFTLALMVVLTLGVGAGLMGLMFYSSRKGYDDLHQPDRDDR